MLAVMGREKQEQQEAVQTTVTVSSEESQTLCGQTSSRLSKLVDWCLGVQHTQEKVGVDDVDARLEDSLRPLVKLYFLKILLVDIGISLGDVVTDLAQGINLVFDSSWNVQWGTWRYGAAVLGCCWLPLLPTLLPLTTFPPARLGGPQSPASRCLATLGLCLVFPLLPTILYCRILAVRRRFPSYQEKLAFHQLEQSTSEVRAVVSALESPLQFTLLLWLQLRGVLSLPWQADTQLESSCVQDSLGRIACLPSLPTASMIFSLLSILKSVLELNLAPVLTAPALPAPARSRLALHFTLTHAPFLLSSVLFRLAVIAIIVTFLDW